jgi:hypothetical protein
LQEFLNDLVWAFIYELGLRQRRGDPPLRHLSIFGVFPSLHNTFQSDVSAEYSSPGFQVDLRAVSGGAISSLGSSVHNRCFVPDCDQVPLGPRTSNIGIQDGDTRIGSEDPRSKVDQPFWR